MSHLYGIYGTAHLSMLISGSSFLAIPYKANMLVNSVANSPSSFILCFRITLSIPFSISSPLISLRSLPSTILNISSKSFVYWGNCPGSRTCPLYLEIPNIIYAHFLGFASITYDKTFRKYFRFYSVREITIPTSIKATSTLALYFMS